MKLKEELQQINAALYELEERKKQILLYLQGYEEAKKESSEIEQQLMDKIKELEENSPCKS